MHPHVLLLKVAFLNEALGAEGALERALAGVDFDVPVQVVSVQERAVTVRTRVHPPGLGDRLGTDFGGPRRIQLLRLLHRRSPAVSHVGCKTEMFFSAR